MEADPTPGQSVKSIKKVLEKDEANSPVKENKGKGGQGSGVSGQGVEIGPGSTPGSPQAPHLDRTLFCFRIRCEAILFSPVPTSSQATNIHLPSYSDGTQDLMGATALTMEVATSKCPKAAVLYINVFACPHIQAPTPKGPVDWPSIPMVSAKFDHHGGDKLVRFSCVVAVHPIVIYEMGKAGKCKGYTI